MKKSSIISQIQDKMIQKIYSQFIFYDFQIINESGEGKSTQSEIKLEKKFNWFEKFKICHIPD